MLLIARDGGTDQELSQNLRVSVPTVKKMWLSIYRRVADHLPALSANQSQPDVWSVRRGKEKKRGLLAYLREHPEELRPVCRRRTPIGQIGERKSRRRLEVRL